MANARPVKPPEFKFWYSATKATLIALACTLTRATDVPVYWPILLVYFFVLFGLTMRRQIQCVGGVVEREVGGDVLC